MAFALPAATPQEIEQATAVERLWEASVEVALADFPSLVTEGVPGPGRRIFIPMQKPNVRQRQDAAQALRALGKTGVFHVPLSRLDEDSVTKLFKMFAEEGVRDILLLGGDRTPGVVPPLGTVAEFMRHPVFHAFEADSIGLAAFPTGNGPISVDEGLDHLEEKVAYLKLVKPHARVFLVTQYCSDPKVLADFLGKLRQRKTLKDVEVIIGVSGPSNKEERTRFLAKLGAAEISAKISAVGLRHLLDPRTLGPLLRGFGEKWAASRRTGGYNKAGDYDTLGYVNRFLEISPVREKIAFHIYPFGPLHKTAGFVASCAPKPR